MVIYVITGLYHFIEVNFPIGKPYGIHIEEKGIARIFILILSGFNRI